MTETAFMVDTIGSTAGPILSSAFNKPGNYILAYISGTGGVEWTPAQINAIRGRSIRNYQGYGPVPPLDECDELDIERGALTPAVAAAIVRGRVNAGYEWTGLYGGDQALADTAAAIRALGHSVWNGHVFCRLADWNLNQSQAAKLVGSFVHGMTCVGVQYASGDNPPDEGLLIPGTNLTLKAANADLSVVDASWVPSTLAPAPVPPASVSGLLVLGDLSSRRVASADGGASWR